MTQEGRGFYLHDFPWRCYNCCCRVCTGRLCPYRHEWGVYKHRCGPCVESNGEMSRCLECDFFESKYVRPQHFKIKSRRKLEGPLEKKLDAIMVKLGMNPNDPKE